MLRKVRNLGLTVMGLVAMVTAVADAHYLIISGSLVYHSLDCQSVLKDVLDPVTNPAVGVCSMVGTSIEIECTSPVGKIVRGTASHPIVFDPVSGPVESDEVTKKGKAAKAAGHLKLEILSDAEVPTLGLTAEEAGCNNLWTVTRALLREADLTIDVYPCAIVDGTPDCSQLQPQASTALFSCILPAEFTLDDVPLPDGTNMDCSLESFEHLN